MQTPRLTSMQMSLYNAISFQLVWWSGVLWGNASLLFVGALLAIHLFMSAQKRADMVLIFRVTVLGMGIDCLLMLLNIFDFNEFPYWLVIIWALFSLSLHYSLSWLRHLPRYLQAVFGAVAGSLSYLAGARFDAMTLPYGESVTVIVLCVIWGVLLPVTVVLAHMHPLKQPQVQ